MKHDKHLLQQRFSRRLESYASLATVQRSIADRLAEMLVGGGWLTAAPRRGVEIGAGSGSQVFHLEFLGPDGKEVPVYAKNLRFENGRGAYEFQTAFNDPKGTWTLLVKNVNSGLAAKTAVELK